MSRRWLDLDRILSEEERVPCVLERNGAGLGFLDTTGDHADLHAGARIELPLWMALSLFKKHMITLELPKHFQRKMRDNINMGAGNINLKEFSSYYGEVGMLLAEALDDRDLKNTLLTAFSADRYRLLMNSLCTSNEDNTDFANDLTVREAQLYFAGLRGSRELELWKRQQLSQLKTSSVLASRSSHSIHTEESRKKLK